MGLACGAVSAAERATTSELPAALRAISPAKAKILTTREASKIRGQGIKTSTFTLKIPGRTDAVITTATNPGGNHPPGHQSATFVKNNLAR
jgi:hypothetical protein